MVQLLDGEDPRRALYNLSALTQENHQYERPGGLQSIEGHKRTDTTEATQHAPTVKIHVQQMINNKKKNSKQTIMEERKEK